MIDKHILDSLPVDEDRIYFTGNSGGGAQAFRNASRLDGCGVLPNAGFLPGNYNTPRCPCFILNGGWDFNRYTSAHTREKLGENAVHRFFDGGHSPAPDWLMIEGMLWLEGIYLADKGDRSPEEQAFYVQSVLSWIHELKKTEPYRAYYWTLFLQDRLSLCSFNRATVKMLVRELRKDENNRLYVDGLQAIDELSIDYLSGFGSGSLHDHEDEDLIELCDELLETYKGVPLIEEVLLALRKPTT